MEINAGLSRARVEFWDSVGSPTDNQYFSVSFTGNSMCYYVGTQLVRRNNRIDEWHYHATEYTSSSKIRKRCDLLGLPYVWEDSILFHPGVKVHDLHNEEICQATKYARIGRLLQ